MNANLCTFVPLTFSRRGVRLLGTTSAVAPDSTFLVGLSRAFYWNSLLDAGVMKSGSEIARRECLHPSVVNELLRLTLLAPDIITQLMCGHQPRRLTLMWFQRNRLPVDWQAQRAIIDAFK
ncbi:MAG: site-specific recombinase resolvase [Rhodoferax sp.]|uniref:site-specific recombinase resolvase n=1 Tax=Rhodoferax sp. TaxID=50421 RepID=UPI001B497E6D|nr:site-specific recombinase resolvase [Rhodoferax sp.]MBP9904544.1 site-specific recombinase resolvase [Rhodoferax sp.]